jgi:IBR domain, a half RING-finger domain
MLLAHYITIRSVDIAIMTTLPMCGHSYCTECLRGYFQSRILEGRVKNVSCFYPVPDADRRLITDLSEEDQRAIIHPHCGCIIEESLIRNVVAEDSTLAAKFERFLVLKSDERCRECAQCGNLQRGATCFTFIVKLNLLLNLSLTFVCDDIRTTGDPASPAIVCTACGAQYCYYHAAAHPPSESCEDYDKRMKTELKSSVDLIQVTAKPCPNPICGMHVSKTGGCNHMKCQCGQAFCWLCGEAIDDAIFPAHFQWWNINRKLLRHLL